MDEGRLGIAVGTGRLLKVKVAFSINKAVDDIAAVALIAL